MESALQEVLMVCPSPSLAFHKVSTLLFWPNTRFLLSCVEFGLIEFLAGAGCQSPDHLLCINEPGEPCGLAPV